MNDISVNFLQIYCSVGVTKNPQEEPCKKTVSPYFYAGIKV